MIGDEALVQVFATVLTGVFIFLTVEKRNPLKIRDYVPEADFARLDELSQEGNKITTEIRDFLEKWRKRKERIESLDSKEVEQLRQQLDILTRTDEEQKKEQASIFSKIDKNIQMAERYINLKTTEGRITLFMILFLSLSVIWMVMVSSIDFDPNEEVAPHPNNFDRLFSSSMFLIGIALFITRVYLHGIEVESPPSI